MTVCWIASHQQQELGYFAKSWERSAKALNSRALPAGSRKNMVDCSPVWPSKRV